MFIFKPNINKLEKNKKFNKIFKAFVGSKDNQIIESALCALCRLNYNPSTKDILKVINTSRDESTIEFLTNTIIESKEKNSCEKLIDILIKTKNDKAKEIINKKLEKYKDGSLLDKLYEILINSSEESVRWTITEALIRLNESDRKLKELVYDLLNNRDRYLFDHAIMIIKRTAQQWKPTRSLDKNDENNIDMENKLIDKLYEILINSSEESVRWTITEALIRLNGNDRKLKELVYGLLNNCDRYLFEHAVMIIKRTAQQWKPTRSLDKNDENNIDIDKKLAFELVRYLTKNYWMQKKAIECLGDARKDFNLYQAIFTNLKDDACWVTEQILEVMDDYCQKHYIENRWERLDDKLAGYRYDAFTEMVIDDEQIFPIKEIFNIFISHTFSNKGMLALKLILQIQHSRMHTIALDYFFKDRDLTKEDLCLYIISALHIKYLFGDYKSLVFGLFREDLHYSMKERIVKKLCALKTIVSSLILHKLTKIEYLPGCTEEKIHDEYTIGDMDYPPSYRWVSTKLNIEELKNIAIEELTKRGNTYNDFDKCNDPSSWSMKNDDYLMLYSGENALFLWYPWEFKKIKRYINQVYEFMDKFKKYENSLKMKPNVVNYWARLYNDKCLLVGNLELTILLALPPKDGRIYNVKKQIWENL